MRPLLLYECVLDVRRTTTQNTAISNAFFFSPPLKPQSEERVFTTTHTVSRKTSKVFICTEFMYAAFCLTDYEYVPELIWG